MDESKQFQEAIAKYTFNYGATSATSIHGYTHGYRDGAAAQRQVGPCGKHPVACLEAIRELCTNADCVEAEMLHEHIVGERCRWCASEQALRAERDTTIAELSETIVLWTKRGDSLDVQIAERDKQLAAREGELTTLCDKLRGLTFAAREFLNSTACGRNISEKGHKLAALLAEEAGR